MGGGKRSVSDLAVGITRVMADGSRTGDEVPVGPNSSLVAGRSVLTRRPQLGHRHASGRVRRIAPADSWMVIAAPMGGGKGSSDVEALGIDVFVVAGRSAPAAGYLGIVATVGGGKGSNGVSALDIEFPMAAGRSAPAADLLGIESLVGGGSL